MKRQIWVIHGGGVFKSYREYLAYLKRKEITDLKRANAKGWKAGLDKALGRKYEVMAPRMPNRENAKYIEWKIWFEKHLPFMRRGAILVGHSLGGVFLAKYLAEKKLPKAIAGTFLVAPPYDKGDFGRLPEFALPKSLAKLVQGGGAIHLYFSKDDPHVAFAELAKYQRALPGATVRVFKNRKHFNQERFPEIVADIKAL